MTSVSCLTNGTAQSDPRVEVSSNPTFRALLIEKHVSHGGSYYYPLLLLQAMLSLPKIPLSDGLEGPIPLHRYKSPVASGDINS